MGALRGPLFPKEELLSGFDNTSETVRAVTATTTLTANDYVLLADPAGGAITVNLPAVATTQPGRTQ